MHVSSSSVFCPFSCRVRSAATTQFAPASSVVVNASAPSIVHLRAVAEQRPEQMRLGHLHDVLVVVVKQSTIGTRHHSDDTIVRIVHRQSVESQLSIVAHTLH